MVRRIWTRLAASMRQQFSMALAPRNPQTRPSLMQINKHPAPSLRDSLKRRSHRPLAFAIERPEHIAVNATRMHTYQHVALTLHLPVHERQVCFAIQPAHIADDFKLSVRRAN